MLADLDPLSQLCVARCTGHRALRRVLPVAKSLLFHFSQLRRASELWLEEVAETFRESLLVRKAFWTLWAYKNDFSALLTDSDSDNSV